MKIKNLLTLLAIAGIMIFASCKKDESTPDPLSKTEAEAAFTVAETDFNNVADGLETLTGLTVLNNFDDLGLPNLTKKSVPQFQTVTAEDQKHLPSFVKVGSDFIYDSNPYVGFNFNDFKGTWTYTTSWSHSTTPTDKVVLVMPYGDGGTATLTYSEYETDVVDGETYTSHLKAEYKISTQTTPVMTWVYSSTRTLTTHSYKFIYTIGEYTKTKTYSDNGYGSVSKVIPSNASQSWSIVWEKNNSIILARSYAKEMTYNNDQSATVAISGNYRVKDIVVKWNIGYNTTTTDFSNPNNYIEISVWTTDGAKVADIIFKVPVAKSEYVLYIVFNDGTEVPLSNYIDSLYEVLYYYTWYISGRD